MLLVVVASILVPLFFLVSIAQLFGGGSQHSSDPVPTTTRTTSTDPSSERPRSDRSPTSRQRSESPTPTETPKKKSKKKSKKTPKKKRKSGPKRQHPKGGKAHQRTQHGYEVIPLPAGPSNYDAAWKVVQHSKSYRRSVVDFPCSTLPNEADYPFGSTSKAAFRRVMQREANCLSDLWSVPLAKAGYQATYVKVVAFSGSVNSPCGSASYPGFYCSTNQTIYMNMDGGGAGPRSDYQWMWYVMTMAHEYGHHVQARTGIYLSAWMLQRDQQTEAGYWEMSRRTELQANCFGGMGLRRMTGLDPQVVDRYISSLTGEGEHGSNKNQYLWYVEGWQQSRLGKCNTYTAGKKWVS